MQVCAQLRCYAAFAVPLLAQQCSLLPVAITFAQTPIIGVELLEKTAYNGGNRCHLPKSVNGVYVAFFFKVYLGILRKGERRAVKVGACVAHNN